MTAPRPAGVPWLTPYLTVRDARASMDFYRAALGFAVRDSVEDDGAIMHVEMTYHDQLIVMFAPEGAFGSTARTPKSAQTVAPQSFYLYVDDVDAVYARALEAGAKSLSEPQDQFWGDRFAQVEDLDGYRWALARHLSRFNEK
ncbi:MULTISPECIES: VOC family protein [Paraburkholderia]|uniref:VOC family protein n=3 Tax=Paraburkholderia TaxID=1822464 RepID=A0ABU9SDE7_9BURK|nr:VOC family protein [Paraburkholderia nodosa]